ncbi:GNAT family N-acetyltransferase [Porphyromonas gingivicanis]|uniref:GNAT family N-acetyltransferase n=1 Tax=Porphyromonas gingivicanis TaxID=266762 RepID=UPI000471C0E6|nr:GNAT family protein [Porphyromonas gingivicanis]
MNGLTDRNEHGMARSYTFVNPDLKGKGLGSLSLSLKCGTGFYLWGLRKIWTYLDFDNEISQKLCERVGFIREGLLRKEGFRDNEYFDLLYYGMLEPDFDRDRFEKYMSECDNRVWKALK